MIQLVLNSKLLSLSNNLLETMILNAFDSKAGQALSVKKQDNWAAWWQEELAVDFNSMGYVITVADNVVNVRGLNKVMLGEVVYISYSFITPEGTTKKGE